MRWLLQDLASLVMWTSPQSHLGSLKEFLPQPQRLPIWPCALALPPALWQEPHAVLKLTEAVLPAE